jgi:hypothetical protein
MHANKIIRSTIATLSLLAGCVAVEGRASAASTKLVVTSCCEFRAPSNLRFSIDGDSAEASSGGLSVSVFSTSGFNDAADEAVAAMGGGSVTYETASSQWHVKSGYLTESPSTIYYVRVEFDRGCDESGVLVINFPKAKKPRFSGAVTTMSKSFRSDLCG